MAIDASSVGLLAAFAAGAVSFLSPCVLPLVPGYVSYVAGQSAAGERDSLRTLGLSLCFVLGFTTIFVAFGAGASALGFALLAHREVLNLASGLLVILFGLFTAGLLRPAWLQRELRWHGDPPGQGPVSAYLLGMAFAFGWTPCIGPVLGAILAITASWASGTGVVLLTVYSLGLGVPFVAAALFLSGFVVRLRTLRWFGRALQILGGGVMVAMGVLMVSNRMTEVAALIMEAFPGLGRIG